MFDFAGIQNLDLLSVGISIAGMGVLGVAVYLHNRRSATNIVLLLFTITAILWSIFNYSYYQPGDATRVLWLLRVHAFFAVWYTFFLFYLFLVFPEERYRPPVIVKMFLMPVTLIAAAITLTPLVFEEVTTFTGGGRIDGVDQGPGISFFGGTIVFLVTSGFFILVRKLLKSPKKSMARQNFI